MKGGGVRQLTLGVALREGHAFANFRPGRNRTAFAALRELAHGAGGPLVYLWGADGTGKTHLLQAACAEAAEGARATAYVPLAGRAKLDPAVLAGLDSAHLICIDDVHAIAGQRAWEEALFHLYNQADAAGVPMAMAADRPPLKIPFGLEDLKSRLAAGTTFHVLALDDGERAQVLVDRAKARGFEFPQEAVSYLLSRGPRDMHSLVRILDQLDALSLTQQRKVTLPMVREVLRGSQAGG